MPKTKRIVLPGYPHHVFQRGHNKQAVFKVPEDFRRFFADLRELKALFEVRVYGWCLTSNQVHLLVEPPADGARLGECLKGLFARTRRYRNRIERRTGTIWEGRYRSSPVHPDWAMRCIRYMERLLIDLRLVDSPECYPWSSYHARIGEQANGWGDGIPHHWALEKSPAACRDQYQRFVNQQVAPGERAFIRDVLLSNQLTGPSWFVEDVAGMTGMGVLWRKRGRPRKT